MARAVRVGAQSMVWLLTLVSSVIVSPLMAQSRYDESRLYDRPALVIDLGMHVAQISSVAVDAEGSLAVTSSTDKTVRLWSPSDGRLLRTFRMPAGPDNVGKIYASAISPDGQLIAAGGWTNHANDQPIYIIETASGRIIKRISGVLEVAVVLAFSPDGRYLAAGLGTGFGLHIYDRSIGWDEVFHDTDYDGAMYGVTFASDGRLAAATLNGEISLYDSDRNFRRAAHVIIGVAFSGSPLALTATVWRLGTWMGQWRLIYLMGIPSPSCKDRKLGICAANQQALLGKLKRSNVVEGWEYFIRGRNE
jgi:WD40 repeat protein